jgi:hypothetical protein
MVRSSLWGLAGTVVPAALATSSAGLIARALGPEEFGLVLLLVGLLAVAGMLDGGVNGVLVAAIPSAFVLWAEHITLGGVLVSMVLARIAGLLILLGLPMSRLSSRSSQLRWNSSLAQVLFTRRLGCAEQPHQPDHELCRPLRPQQPTGRTSDRWLLGRAAPVPTALSAALFPRLCANLDDQAAVRRAAQLMVGVCVAL